MKEPAAKNRNHPIVSFSFPITSQFTTAKKKVTELRVVPPKGKQQQQASKPKPSGIYSHYNKTIIINSIISPEPKYVNDFSI